MLKTLLLLLLSLCAAALAQTTTLDKVALPDGALFGASYNQFTGWTGTVTAIKAESNAARLFGSLTADVNAVRITDPATAKLGYGLSPNVRFGQHEALVNTAKTTLAIGGDAGASFSQAPSTSAAANVQIGFAGSFTVTYIRWFNAHWGAAVPIRMLYLGPVGPSGRGVWNPVVGLDLAWRK